MPAEPTDVTPAPLIDSVAGGLFLQFHSGACVLVQPGGVDEKLFTNTQPTPAEIAKAVELLHEVDEHGYAEALRTWGSAA